MWLRRDVAGIPCGGKAMWPECHVAFRPCGWKAMWHPSHVAGEAHGARRGAGGRQSTGSRGPRPYLTTVPRAPDRSYRQAPNRKPRAHGVPAGWHSHTTRRNPTRKGSMAFHGAPMGSHQARERGAPQARPPSALVDDELPVETALPHPLEQLVAVRGALALDGARTNTQGEAQGHAVVGAH